MIVSKMEAPIIKKKNRLKRMLRVIVGVFIFFAPLLMVSGGTCLWILVAIKGIPIYQAELFPRLILWTCHSLFFGVFINVFLQRVFQEKE